MTPCTFWFCVISGIFKLLTKHFNSILFCVLVTGPLWDYQWTNNFTNERWLCDKIEIFLGYWNWGYYQQSWKCHGEVKALLFVSGKRKERDGRRVFSHYLEFVACLYVCLSFFATFSWQKVHIVSPRRYASSRRNNIRSFKYHNIPADVGRCR